MDDGRSNESIAEAFARRDRFRMAMEARRTPRERMDAFYQLQRSGWKSMSPEARAFFIRRNVTLRAIDASKFNGA